MVSLGVGPIGSVVVGHGSFHRTPGIRARLTISSASRPGYTIFEKTDTSRIDFKVGPKLAVVGDVSSVLNSRRYSKDSAELWHCRLVDKNNDKKRQSEAPKKHKALDKKVKVRECLYQGCSLELAHSGNRDI